MAALVTICRNYSWASPKYVNKMYCDDKDYHGIFFWMKDVEEQHKQMAVKPKT